MIGIIAAALFFGCVAFLASYAADLVCAGITRPADGPPSGKPPVTVLIIASALIGGLIVARGGTQLTVEIVAIALFACVASWCSDVLCGVVPDVFTLAPLGALLVFAAVSHSFLIVFAWAFFPFAVFAIAAFFSHGIGMGWGDAKLVALAGAVLGDKAILLLAAACIAALVGYRLKGIRSGPIAFAPYIAASIGIGIAVFAHWSA